MTSCPLSQGHPCPQLFAKRHQTSIGKDVHKDLLAERKREEKMEREREKRKREGERKIYTAFCDGEIDWFTNGI
jgi:hypothetical protein